MSSKKKTANIDSAKGQYNNILAPKENASLNLNQNSKDGAQISRCISRESKESGQNLS